MSDAQSADRDGRTIWPLLAAVAVILLVFAGILLSNRFSPAGDDVTDADRIAVAVGAFVVAHADEDRNQWQTVVCPSFDEHRSPLPDEPRQVEVSAVDKVAVSGDRATAEVTTEAGGTSTTRVWNLTRTDGAWRVCNRDG